MALHDEKRFISGQSLHEDMAVKEEADRIDVGDISLDHDRLVKLNSDGVIDYSFLSTVIENYIPLKSYKKNDLVFLDGFLYKNIIDNNTSEPKKGVVLLSSLIGEPDGHQSDVKNLGFSISGSMDTEYDEEKGKFYIVEYINFNSIIKVLKFNDENKSLNNSNFLTSINFNNIDSDVTKIRGISFASDGMVLYIFHRFNNYIRLSKYSLTAYKDISTASLIHAEDVISEDNGITGSFNVSNDESFILFTFDETIRCYNFNTPGDLSLGLISNGIKSFSNKL
jgi:hypothetical protein